MLGYLAWAEGQWVKPLTVERPAGVRKLQAGLRLCLALLTVGPVPLMAPPLALKVAPPRFALAFGADLAAQGVRLTYLATMVVLPLSVGRLAWMFNGGGSEVASSTTANGRTSYSFLTQDSARVGSGCAESDDPAEERAEREDHAQCQKGEGGRMRDHEAG